MQPPQDDIYSLLDTYLRDIRDGDILFITSKVVSIHQGLCIPVDTTSKIDLVKREAEKYIVSDIVPGRDIYLTLKNNILIPSAGIDESNADGHYILWPRDMGDFCTQVHTHICARYGIKNL
jgi:F420-0:gamma-glutamyl ligase